jgi:alkylhydroperoxidase family enzyme
VVAFNHHYPYCIELNSGLLQHFQGLTEAEVAAIRTDPRQARLDEKDRAMLVFVHRAVTAPEDVEASDLDRLRGLGWTDPDIYDAVSYGANMVSSGILFHAFKMSEA